jgi:hypothetical protein
MHKAEFCDPVYHHCFRIGDRELLLENRRYRGFGGLPKPQALEVEWVLCIESVSGSWPLPSNVGSVD